MFSMTRALALSLLLIFVTTSAHGQDAAALRWFKGNTHTHTLNSDGDSTPDEVVRWYREHGYNFLVLTDHNFLTAVDALNALHGADQQFLVIRGEEVSDWFEGKQVHVNGLNLQKLVKPQGGSSTVEVIQRNVDAIREAEGVPHINHPNFNWAITAEDLKKIENDKLFEIFNGHPYVNNQGGGGSPGLEEVWDIVLTSGKLLYGIAVDDAHHFKRPWAADAARPGQGWVVVRAATLSPQAILEAMERGDFYASTGVELKAYELTGEGMTITIRESGGAKYTTRFIGRGGAVLAEAQGNPAVYRFRGNEGYVRAKVTDSNGRVAWIQPVMIAPKR
jgi:hypothetical protein